MAKVSSSSSSWCSFGRIIQLVLANTMLLVLIWHISTNDIYSSLATSVPSSPPSNDTELSSSLIQQTLVVHGGDSAAGFATNYYTYVINFILYAQSLQMDLSIQYGKEYNDKYYDANIGDNSFHYFFDPINSIQDNNDDHNNDYVLHLDPVILPYDRLPFIHHISNQSVHSWYYDDYSYNTLDRSTYYEEWYHSNRVTASNIVSKYIHPKQEILDEVNSMWQKLMDSILTTSQNQKGSMIVLGVQMRGTDKGGLGRHKLEPDLYLQYILQFVLYFRAQSMIPKVFIATDDTNYLRYIETYWHFEGVINVDDDPSISYQNVVRVQPQAIRSKFRRAVFSRTDVSKYESGKSCLIDILLLSKCDWFIHSSSAVAEAVHWNNIKLHHHSVHLEYEHKRQCPEWYDPQKFKGTEWPRYETLIYAPPEECQNERYPVAVADIFCDGMFSIHAIGAEMCRGACCADKDCDIYLWCDNREIGGNACKRANCWIGKRQDQLCYEQEGWKGGTVSQLQLASDQ